MHIVTLIASSMNFGSICFLFWLFVTSALASVLQLELNPHAPLASDLESTNHDIQACQIIVKLQPSRRCRKPTFHIRISGTSLLIMKLDETTATAEADKLVYTYPQLMDEGVYFVEVLVLFCTSFDPEHFDNTCLENGAGGSNIVTLPYSFHVAANETAEKRNPTILTTRYQKRACMLNNHRAPCGESAADVLPYDVYDWVDGPDYATQLAEVLTLSRTEQENKESFTAEHANIRMCLIGDSHARELFIHGKKLGVRNVKFVYVLTQYPHQFEIDWLKSYQCSYAVVTYGQWPASERVNGHPYSQSKFQEEMRRVVTLLQKYDPKLTQVFVRSINYNGLGARHTACPPGDFRSPPVIDMYNAVLRKLVKELNVPFIDLIHIIGPKWDGAQDWSHPVGKVATAEIEWILYKSFNYSVQRKMGVVLYASDSPENTLIKFSDSDTVFLYQNAALHGFPNVHTFKAMGYEFGDVQTVHPSRRADFVVGAMLPPSIV